MAIIVDFPLDDTVYENAYLVIKTVRVSQNEYEFFEVISENEERLSTFKKIECTATVFVWPDEVARRNNARPIHWFDFKFEWPEGVDKNPLSVAYEQLLSSDEFKNLMKSD